MAEVEPEVERIAELCWRAWWGAVGRWPKKASYAHYWRAIARAVIADRAAHPPVPVTDGPTLAEVVRERDDLRARLDAMRREPTPDEIDRLEDEWEHAVGPVARWWWQHVRDALLTTQGPPADPEEDEEVGCYLMDRCAACGHRLRGSASHCPQCEAAAPATEPESYPDMCECRRCTDARRMTAKEPK